MFPKLNNFDKNKQNLQIQIYGQRLYADQTLYEYLLEFLLVFISPKGSNSIQNADDGFSFIVPENGENLTYFPSPRMGLKRFVFFERSEQEKRYNVDKDALEAQRDLLKRKINLGSSLTNKDYVLDVIQDLFYGFNAVIGKRSWFAQSLLPVSPELIFCEAMGKKQKREKIEYKHDLIDVDKDFEFNGHVFMARGGEVYFLHIVQGLKEAPEFEKGIIEGLKSMVTSVPQLSILAEYIQKQWQDFQYEDLSNDSEVDGIRFVKKDAKWIPKNYSKRAKNSVIELSNLLQSELDPFEKIELVGKLIALQIIRMMCLQSSLVLSNDDQQEWLLDFTDDSKGSIRKMAVESYRQVEENVFRAVHHADIESYKGDDANKDEMGIFNSALKDTSRLVRKLAKDINLLIPPKGANMRFSLDEELIKILVVSLIEPGERLLFSTFLEKCYEHFKIVIGPNESLKHFTEIQELDLGAFDSNEYIFQQLLKSCGYLRNLSDATSIVENPFKG
ncbi:hypothetical protein PGC35_18660 [Psychrobacillus sp. PGGUH221]|uniref:hypothetical protein n=1 Tax=Psychrobacillus sp. PGGUH221 TaxID=3020058 RepID=UPI0035C6C4D3